MTDLLVMNRGLGLALALSLAGSLRLLWQASTETPNELPPQMARFANVVRAIPGTDVAGYFSDRGYEGPLPTPPFPVRYVFAPRMLVWFPDGAVGEWVIGDHARAKQPGLQFVRDFGDGIVLYRR